MVGMLCYKMQHHMKKFIFASLVLAAVAFAGLSMGQAKASYSDPLPNASCVDGVLKIYINPQGVSKRSAVRIDDLSNPWNPTTPVTGDVIENNFTGSAYVMETEVAKEYSWWIHFVDDKGVYSEPKGGRVYCVTHAPINTASSYEYPYATLTWKPVKGAVRYAIRIDDIERSPGAYNPLPFNPEIGDRIDDTVTTNTYRFKVGRNRKFTWWVHAVDKYGAYSAPSRVLHLDTF